MVTIRNGNKTFGNTDPPQKDMDHLGYLVFDAVTWCQMNRTQALILWERMERLQEKISENPDHPNTAKAQARMSSINNAFLQHQVAFLKWEGSLHSLWKDTEPKQCVDAEMNELLHNPHWKAFLPPLWHHPLGSQEGAPLSCPMTPTALQFSDPATARRYRSSGTR
jgi:hypothetical protein